MTIRPSVLVIFGTSHAGKSTLADRLGQELGWPVVSTDQLARHPGRPWPNVKAPVAEYYSRLTDDTIYWLLQAHHQNMWPHIHALITSGCEAGTGLILEGSALRPEFLATLTAGKIHTIGLHAEGSTLRERMKSSSGYEQLDEHHRLLVDKFIARSLRDNEEIRKAALQSGHRLADTTDKDSLDRLTGELRAVLSDISRSRS